MVKHIMIDQDVCVGAAYCTRAVSELFVNNAEGVVALHDAERPNTGPVILPLDLEPRVAKVASACPSSAITIAEVPT